MNMLNTTTAPKTNWRNTLQAFIITAIFVVLLCSLAWSLWQVFVGLPKELAVAVVAGSVTILVSVFSLIGSKYFERRREIEQEHRKQKMPIYEEFMTFWLRVLLAGRPGQIPVPQEEVIQFMTTFTQKMIIWGSDNVVKEHANFRRQVTKNPENAITTLLLFEKLLYAMRADIGHQNKGLANADLLSLFVNDISEGMQQIAKGGGAT
jgi:hypothetical protein